MEFLSVLPYFNAESSAKTVNLYVASGPGKSNYGRTEREVLLRANFLFKG